MAPVSSSPIVRLLNERVHHYHRWCTPSVLPTQERVDDFYASDVSISAGFFGTLVDHTGVFAEAEAFAAQAESADRTMFSVHGSSGSNFVVLRMLALGRPRAGRFGLGVLAGAAATASGVGLLSVSAWLIAMAATQPPLTLLSIAIVATRALGVLRGVTRYLERLVTHDAALRTLADARARVYARLAHTEPVRRFRSGDLVTRLVSDTDATQDLLVRGLAPPAAALLTGAGVVALCTALLAPGGLLLAAGLLLGGVGVPVAAALAGRGPGRRATAARAELATALIDTVHGAPDLLAYGAMDRAVARVADTDAELTRVARRDAALLGLGAGASALIAGLTLWGTLLLGVAAVHDGALGGVPLTVLVLTALAAFEIVAPLPAAAARLGLVRAAGARLFALLDVPPSVRARRESTAGT